MAQTVRDGQKVAATCPDCGCRLKKLESSYSHFLGVGERDARGCICPSIYKIWFKEGDSWLKFDARSFTV